MTWIDEIMAIARNKTPISFDAAMRSQAGYEKIMVFVDPLKQDSVLRFDAWRHWLSPALLDRVKLREIRLLDGSRMLFLTEHEIEQGALRGLSDVLWMSGTLWG